jgi:imidazole glycerol-phosphate synthase subunit HisH
MQLAIIDYELGNLFSVRQACVNLGYDPIITADPDLVRKADALILPGVGAFGAAMETLRRCGLDTAIREAVKAGTPMMGVCLGMQLLLAESTEFGAGEGLGLVPGKIIRLPAAPGRKIPQIAWNQIQPAAVDWQHSPLAELQPAAYMYFVHSYYCAPDNPAIELTRTSYDGFSYCSALQHENLFATQFHPEKSAEMGLRIYRRWLESI